MELMKRKIKILSLLICTLFLTSIFLGLATAKNHIRIDTSTTTDTSDVRSELNLIKITEENPDCDIDKDFIVYADSAYLYIYTIKTGETDDVHLGGDIVFPKISDHRVVYYDFSYMGFKMYDLDTSETTDLIITNWQGGDTDDFQFYGNYIVYENTDLGLNETEIYLYNITSSENIQLTDSPGEYFTQNPCIYKNIVAWQLANDNLNDIVMYNIDSHQYTRVTNTSEFVQSETYPSIYETTMIYSYFYYDKPSGTILYALKMYNITTGNETTIFSGEEPTASSPELYGNIIAYSVPGVRLCLYDVCTNDDTPIYDTSDLVQPWNLNEEYIVFTVLGEGVFLYKYTSSAIEIQDVTGGVFKVHTVIKNTGDTAATNVQWSITLTGGLIILGKESNGTIPTIAAGAAVDISSKVIFGFGKTVITVTADTATKSQNATALFVFIKIQK